MKALFAEYLVWDTPFQVGSHYYARHFMQQAWEIGWLGGEFHLFNLLNNREELRRKFPIWREGGRRVPGGPWEYTAFKVVPYRRWGPLDSESLAWDGLRWTIPSVRRVLARSGFDHADLLWLTNILGYPALIHEKTWQSIVYRAADDYSAFAASPRSLRNVEKEIVRRADIVFAVSHAVYKRFRCLRKEGVYYLSNGVDLNRFTTIQPCPPEYQTLNHPIAVYVGNIQNRIDYDLLLETARHRDDVSFVLIGQARVPLKKLTQLLNVWFLGTRSPDVIPAYLQHADVGLIPFVRSPLTDAVNPLKMYEYMASGLPVISTDLAEVRASHAPVTIIHDAASFSNALDAAFEGHDADPSQYRAYAAQNSWNARCVEVDKILNQLS